MSDALTASGGIVTDVWTRSHEVLNSPLFANTERPLLDAFARVCWRHQLGEATKGGAVTCLACRRTFVAKWRRPPRSGGGHCGECGHAIPRGPKQPKMWVWVDVETLVPKELLAGG